MSDSNRYQKLAVKTESIPSNELTSEQSMVLPAYLDSLIAAGNHADTLKRSIFYGAKNTVIDQIDHQETDGITTKLTQIELRLIHAMLGMFSEAGELAEALHKSIILGMPLDLVNIAEEFGDSLWYHAIGLDAIGLEMTVAMSGNIAKLKTRYPDGFNEDDAVNRNASAEIALIDITCGGHLIDMQSFVPLGEIEHVLKARCGVCEATGTITINDAKRLYAMLGVVPCDKMKHD